MNPEQARTTIVETFRQKFDDARFLYFIRNLVNHLDESKKQTWTTKYIKAAFADFVNHFTRLGTYADPDGEKVDVLVIHLRKDTTLARGRVTLRNFVADYLTTGHGHGKAAVIAAFVSPDEDDWRFSFVKLDYTFEKTDLGLVTERRDLTPARRYSYLVGANENCHTAQKQFLALLEADQVNPTVAQLENAFSVEKVTREFFEHYRELFEKTRDALVALLDSAPAIKQHFGERGIACDDFTKKLLGQIVFLYFLQKKGWFGVERGKAWGTGRKDFIRHLFVNRVDYAHAPGSRRRPPNFFNDILEPLFYEALAAPRLDDNHYYSRFDCKIPFLNGGLFEPLYGYNWVETEILLPDTLFSNDEPTGETGEKGTGILDVFDRYNFTVNEAEPLEKEVAVDPEMLGKVFENLLSENIRHASGTYYTPRVIVHYMCQQALLQYLTTRAAEIPQDDLALFLRLAERFADFEARKTKGHADKRLPDSITRNAKRLDELLASITVCDPAIGSGAFPVGMMHEMVRARLALAAVDGMPEQTAYNLKRHAIHHSLYGVDLDPGAVEIAKLRLWLSMVVDEGEIGDIQPLPNLDYKIMQGNSLLDEFEGVRLLDESLLTQDEEKEGSNPRIAELKERQLQLQREVNRLQAAGKLTSKMAKNFKDEGAWIAKELDALKNPSSKKHADHPEFAFGPRESLKRIQELHACFFNENSRTEKDKFRQQLDALEWKFMEATLREQGRETAIAELKRASATHRKPFFLWKLQFAEVFQQHGGFDVVVGNPPYVRIQEIKKADPSAAAALKARFASARKGNYDLYVVFVEKGLQLLAQTGQLAFILPHKFFNTQYGEPLREVISRGRHLRHVVHFGDQQIFSGATNYVCLLFLARAGADSCRWVRVDDLSTWLQTLRSTETELPAACVTAAEWNFASSTSDALLEKLRRRGTRLLDLPADMSRGHSTGDDQVFVVEANSTQVEKEILRIPVFAKDFSRYNYTPNSQWRVIFPYREKEGRVSLLSEEELCREFPKTFRYLSSHRKRLEQRKGARYWFGFTAPRNLDLHDKAQVLVPLLAKTGSYAFVMPVMLGKLCPMASGGFTISAPACHYRIEYLLALLNSRLLFWMLLRISNLFHGGWITCTKQYFGELPIPLIDFSVASERAKHEALVGLVDLILSTKQKDSGADVSALEREIDELVYALYGLTPDEIKIVEEKV